MENSENGIVKSFGGEVDATKILDTLKTGRPKPDELLIKCVHIMR